MVIDRIKAGSSRMHRVFLTLVLGLAWAPIVPAVDGAASAKATADSFGVDEPISIELTLTGVWGLDGYVITVDPAGKNPPMGLYMSGEAGFGSPIIRGWDRMRPLRHMVLLNKWVTLDRPGRYTVTIDSLVGVKRYITSVPITIVERDDARLQQACALWGERANGRSLEKVEDPQARAGYTLFGPASAQRYAQIVLMYLQDESLIPCLLQSASKVNLAPAMAFREMDSIAGVHALHQLMQSPITELSAEARKRLEQLKERTTKKNVRKAVADALTTTAQ